VQVATASIEHNFQCDQTFRAENRPKLRPTKSKLLAKEMWWKNMVILAQSFQNLAIIKVPFGRFFKNAPNNYI
jgi:hypothetical protein